jgi:hypothetical protein
VGSSPERKEGGREGRAGPPTPGARRPISSWQPGGSTDPTAHCDRSRSGSSSEDDADAEDVFDVPGGGRAARHWVGAIATCGVRAGTGRLLTAARWRDPLGGIGNPTPPWTCRRCPDPSPCCWPGPGIARCPPIRCVPRGTSAGCTRTFFPAGPLNSTADSINYCTIKHPVAATKHVHLLLPSSPLELTRLLGDAMLRSYCTLGRRRRHHYAVHRALLRRT